MIATTTMTHVDSSARDSPYTHRGILAGWRSGRLQATHVCSRIEPQFCVLRLLYTISSKEYVPLRQSDNETAMCQMASKHETI